MTRDDVKALAAVIEALWHGRTKFQSGMIDVWASLLRDDDPAVIGAEVEAHARRGEPHPPTPGQLHAAAAQSDMPTLEELRPWMRHGETPGDIPAAYATVIDALGGSRVLAMMDDDEIVRAWSVGFKRAAVVLAAARLEPSVPKVLAP